MIPLARAGASGGTVLGCRYPCLAMIHYHTCGSRVADRIRTSELLSTKQTWRFLARLGIGSG